MHAPTPLLMRAVLLASSLMLTAAVAVAQGRPSLPAGGGPGARTETSAVDWLRRMHAASRQLNYRGTFVVSAANGELSSARIAHAWDGDSLYERVDVLTGPPRSILRRNHDVMTFLPESRTVKTGRREHLELFPNLSGMPDPAISQLYRARLLGRERVAGLEADILELAPRDRLRFGYRIWSEQGSGLVMKLQTVGDENRVLEQSAFSELQLDAQVDARTLASAMGDTAGYRVVPSNLQHTTASEEGWWLREPVPGFRPLSCYRRAMQPPAAPSSAAAAASTVSAVGEQAPAASDHPLAASRMLQWTFTDGLATVSLFIEPFDNRLGAREALFASGSTYTLSRHLRLPEGEWWLTVVGEVPPRTLDAFARSLARRVP